MECNLEDDTIHRVFYYQSKCRLLYSSIESTIDMNTSNICSLIRQCDLKLLNQSFCQLQDYEIADNGAVLKQQYIQEQPLQVQGPEAQETSSSSPESLVSRRLAATSQEQVQVGDYDRTVTALTRMMDQEVPFSRQLLRTLICELKEKWKDTVTEIRACMANVDQKCELVLRKMNQLIERATQLHRLREQNPLRIGSVGRQKALLKCIKSETVIYNMQQLLKMGIKETQRLDRIYKCNIEDQRLFEVLNRRMLLPWRQVPRLLKQYPAANQAPLAASDQLFKANDGGSSGIEAEKIVPVTPLQGDMMAECQQKEAPISKQVLRTKKSKQIQRLRPRCSQKQARSGKYRHRLCKRPRVRQLILF